MDEFSDGHAIYAASKPKHSTRPTMTHDLAYAVGQDAGNRSMREGNRTAWSDEDYRAACVAFANALLLAEATQIATTAPAPD